MSGDERPCPVCGARAGEVLHHRRFVLPDGHPLADGYTVVTCRECDAAYATPLPPQEAYDRFYRDTSSMPTPPLAPGVAPVRGMMSDSPTPRGNSRRSCPAAMRTSSTWDAVPAACCGNSGSWATRSSPASIRRRRALHR